MRLKALRVREKQRADTCVEPALDQLFTAWLKRVRQRIAQVGALMEALLE